MSLSLFFASIFLHIVLSNSDITGPSGLAFVAPHALHRRIPNPASHETTNHGNMVQGLIPQDRLAEMKRKTHVLHALSVAISPEDDDDDDDGGYKPPPPPGKPDKTPDEWNNDYKRLVGVNGNKMFLPYTHPLQALDMKDANKLTEANAWNKYYIKTKSMDFQTWLVKGFPAGFKEGTYGFVVMRDEDDYMRIVRDDACVGHANAMQEYEYEAVKAGRTQMTYAGEFTVDENGKVTEWSNNSGHFLPDAFWYKVFAHHWGLQDIPFEKHEVTQEMIDNWPVKDGVCLWDNTPDPTSLNWLLPIVQISVLAIVIALCTGCVAGVLIAWLVHKRKQQHRIVDADCV